jgi:molybdate/tungstate transport system substrate-binding protein
MIHKVLAMLGALTLLAAAATIEPAVSVLYAGSLVTPMEGPISAAFTKLTGSSFEGEGKGSRELMHLIEDGLRNPDIFISADPALVKELRNHNLIASAQTFGSASMVLGYSPRSPYRQRFEAVAAGRANLIDALRIPGLRIARTDPRLDPKGERTLRAMHLLASNDVVHAILGDDQNPAQIFPEENLLVRLETGEADVGFLYSTEAISRKIPFIPLPGKASLSDEVTYTLAIMKGAPHPRAAQAFTTFIQSGAGRKILEDAGIRFYATPRELR